MSTANAPASSRVLLCRQCDRLMTLPQRAPGESAHCPRCHHHVAPAAQRDVQRTLAWALAAAIMLGLVFAFDFLSFSTRGIGHTMSFLDAAQSLLGYHYPSLAILLLATTVGLPALYLFALIYLCLGVRAGARLPGAIVLARILRPLEPWLMSDVFIVGVLVALIKIIALADIHIGASFIAFCVYSLLLIRTFTLVDWITLWDGIAPQGVLDAHVVARLDYERSGESQRLMVCHACDTPFLINPAHRCPRCRKRHWSHGADRVQLTWALLVAALILYIPANVYPILSTVTLGEAEPQTIIGGVVHLAAAGSWPIALVIFVASIVVPISKIVAMAWLCLAAQFGWYRNALDKTRLYRITEKIGRWSMIDVFVVAILGSLVQAGALMAIHPGPAALSFAAVVVITMIAALTFDTRLLWRPADHSDSNPRFRPDHPVAPE
ncbi:PqiA/YebS family transporter subunit [Salinisphaera aquimarina]|uniref:PqiA/YebS family transporter subunit n=1 Tax=Salinisphaera aquimarina TaxID=2094031 RepID=A0ABV7ELB8_9GAMM